MTPPCLRTQGSTVFFCASFALEGGEVAGLAGGAFGVLDAADTDFVGAEGAAFCVFGFGAFGIGGTQAQEAFTGVTAGEACGAVFARRALNAGVLDAAGEGGGAILVVAALAFTRHAAGEFGVLAIVVGAALLAVAVFAGLARSAIDVFGAGGDACVGGGITARGGGFAVLVFEASDAFDGEVGVFFAAVWFFGIAA